MKKRKKPFVFWPLAGVTAVLVCVCVSRGHIPLYIAQGAADELALRDQGFLVCAVSSFIAA